LRISVIIPTKNGGILLSKLLRIIREQEIKGEVEFIIVDSGSYDDTVNIANENGATVVKISSQEFTHGRARNLGAAKAKGSYLVFCNQDIVPANRFWLKNLISPLENVQVGGSYSRQIARADASEDVRLFLRHYYPQENRVISLERTRKGGPEDVVLFSTVAAALRKDVWEKFKFNERIIMSEDQEIACRLLLSGYLIAYQASSVVFHSHNYSILDLFGRFFDSGWSMACCPELRVNNPVKILRSSANSCREILNDPEGSASEKVSSLVNYFVKVLGFGVGQLAPYLPQRICSTLSYTEHARIDY
jgi:rhamnosyltransferase